MTTLSTIALDLAKAALQVAMKHAPAWDLSCSTRSTANSGPNRLHAGAPRTVEHRQGGPTERLVRPAEERGYAAVAATHVESLAKTCQPPARASARAGQGPPCATAAHAAGSAP